MTEGTAIESKKQVAGVSVEAAKKVYSKITRRWVPFLFICYLLNYVDRTNISIAKLQMAVDLKFSDTVYGLGAGLFFIGYFLFEVPSNIILQRVGARVWITRIMVTWGIISAAMMFVNNVTWFYILRFLLGIAEAGFFPGIILYLTYWYPSERRQTATGLVMMCTPFAGVVGGIISGWIMKSLSGVQGLAGWQWLFLLEGLPTIVLGVITYFYLKDKPSEVKWLTDEEKRLIEQDLKRDDQAKQSHSMRSAFTDGKVWLLCFIYLFTLLGINAMVFWFPTIVQSMGVKDFLVIGLIGAIPSAAAMIGMIFVSRSADKHRERRWHAAVSMWLGGICIIVGMMLTKTSPVMAVTVFTIGSIFTGAANTVFWGLPTAILGGMAAAAGIALINSIGNLAGFCAPFLVGFMKDLTGNITTPMYILASFALVAGILVFFMPKDKVNR